jgi:endonuclease YncB( thermonuclease family)
LSAHHFFKRLYKTRYVEQAKSQGDQIGRIFAYWEIFYSRYLLENYEIRQNFGATFFPRKKLLTSFDRKMSWAQGDRIGRNFAYWVTGYFWQFFKLHKYPTFLGYPLPR